MNFIEVVQYLENLGIMPKTAIGLHKISDAINLKIWFSRINPKKIITIAGTNGKGTTAAALEALLLNANQKVGLYTSPHLVKTTERIRLNGLDCTEQQFIKTFNENKNLIDLYQLSHFESLTLIAADIFFQMELDYVIFEVGLGGSFDATNIFPNHYSVITKLGLDHQNILGDTIEEIAKNKFGIIKKNSVVVHHKLPEEVLELAQIVKNKTNSKWNFANNYEFKTNLLGPRSIENINTAITLFETLGFEFKKHQLALLKINWPGRMQKIVYPNINCDFYLSGDHNLQGIESLLEIINNLDYKNIHFVVGIGAEKDADQMLQKLVSVKNSKLYLTETPFKGLSLADYPEQFLNQAADMNKEVFKLLSSVKAEREDVVVVTGSLYLVGLVLSRI